MAGSLEFYLLKMFSMLVLLPCGLVAVMPNKRWLLVYVILVTGLIIWAHTDIQAPYRDNPTYDPGFGGSIAKFLFYLAVMIFYAATLARAFGLGLRAEGVRRLWVNVATYSVLAVVTTGFLSTEARTAWNMRGPSSECASATFRVLLAGETYELPAFPWFGVGISDSEGTAQFRFTRDYSLRRFCEHAARSGDPVQLSLININIGLMPSANSMTGNETCKEVRRNRWRTMACETGRPRLEHGSLNSACLSAPDAPNGYSGCPATGNTEDALMKWLADSGGEPAISDGQDDHQVYVLPGERERQYWVLNLDGTSRTFDCELGRSGRWLYCAAEYPYRDGLQLGYTFHAEVGHVPTVAAEADRIVNAFVQELRQGSY